MEKTFPVTVSILSPQALSAEVLPGFGIGLVGECQFYSGGFNHTYRVRAIDGRTYYLRANRSAWRTLDDILVELDVLDHLERKGFPAARPLRYLDGRPTCTVDAPEGRRVLALFTESPGYKISYAQEPGNVARRYGQAVARSWSWK
jgi:Ser/Thr protein kinase RdoA (MazF antagonist)